MAPFDGGGGAPRGPLAGDLRAIAGRLRGITVQIRGPRGTAGSGVIWDPDGLIVTNAHVLGDRRATAAVVLPSGRELAGQVLARGEDVDLAVLRVDATGLPAADVADAVLRAGELVIAVGYPHGLDGAVTTGVVHAATDPVRARFLIADIRLAPGNSGGPLADARGRVVGINAMVSGGLALAVPSRAVRRFVEGLHRAAGQMP